MKSARLNVLVLVSILALSLLTLQRIAFADPITAAPLERLRTHIPYQLSRKPLIPRRIWQTWLTKASNDGHTYADNGPGEDLVKLARSWSSRNPGYQYSRLDDWQAMQYVRRHYRHRPDIIHIFEEAAEPVIRADLIRYLILLEDGGVYTDMDTECYKSVDMWTGDMDSRKVGMIVGVEYDQGEEGNRMPGMEYHVQFSQWTIASKPNHPIMRNVLDRVVKRLLQVEQERGGISVKDQADVYNMTGPSIFTESIRQGMSEHVGYDIDYKSFSMLKGPRMFGDVMVLPINSFASGVPHSGAADWGNEEQLVAHHFRGKWKEGLASATG